MLTGTWGLTGHSNANRGNDQGLSDVVIGARPGAALEHKKARAKTTFEPETNAEQTTLQSKTAKMHSTTKVYTANISFISAWILTKL